MRQTLRGEFVRRRVYRGRLCQGATLSRGDFVRGEFVPTGGEFVRGELVWVEFARGRVDWHAFQQLVYHNLPQIYLILAIF